MRQTADLRRGGLLRSRQYPRPTDSPAITPSLNAMRRTWPARRVLRAPIEAITGCGTNAPRRPIVRSRSYRPAGHRRVTAAIGSGRRRRVRESSRSTSRRSCVATPVTRPGSSLPTTPVSRSHSLRRARTGLRSSPQSIGPGRRTATAPRGSMRRLFATTMEQAVRSPRRPRPSSGMWRSLCETWCRRVHGLVRGCWTDGSGAASRCLNLRYGLGRRDLVVVRVGEWCESPSRPSACGARL